MHSLSASCCSSCLRCVLALAAIVVALSTAARAEENPQYQADDIAVPAASADEPKRDKVSTKLALEYLENGARAWNASRKCVTCHTNGTYMSIRPALSPRLGNPSAEMRDRFIATLKDQLAAERDSLQEGVRPAQSIYVASGLAEWDAHVTKRLSPETEQALGLMLALQRENGTWGSLNCWPPFESDPYHEATVAAMAVATAPGWLAKLQDPAQLAAVEKLKKYLRTEAPAHDYSRVLLLWASTRMTDLLPAEKKQELVDILWKHQREDGGWSIRTFAAPESWGGGNRAEKLKAEPDFDNPASDGHQTGLAIMVLREAGIDAKDPRIQRGVKWLLSNQRASGRWWTRSLNTDSWHFITYSGTMYPVMALSLCDALPNPATETAALTTGQ